MDKKSQNLEIVSDDSTNQTEKRRTPRLNLSSEQFRLAANGKIFPVADISVEGMALRVLETEDLVFFPIGMAIQGVLNLRRVKFPVEAKVKHIGKDLIGCQFKNIDEATAQALREFLDPDSLGRALKPIPSSEPGTLWYQGPSGTYVLLWRGQDGRYKKMVVSALGSLVQWDEKEGLLTGQLDHSFETSETRGAFRIETMLLSRDPQPDLLKLGIAKRVLVSSNLSQDLKTWCIRHLSPS